MQGVWGRAPSGESLPWSKATLRLLLELPLHLFFFTLHSKAKFEESHSKSKFACFAQKLMKYNTPMFG